MVSGGFFQVVFSFVLFFLIILSVFAGGYLGVFFFSVVWRIGWSAVVGVWVFAFPSISGAYWKTASRLPCLVVLFEAVGAPRYQELSNGMLGFNNCVKAPTERPRHRETERPVGAFPSVQSSSARSLPGVFARNRSSLWLSYRDYGLGLAHPPF